MALLADLKTYGEEMILKYKEAVQSVGSVPSARKRKRGTGKFWEKNNEREKSGIERGGTPKVYYARVMIEVWDKRE